MKKLISLILALCVFCALGAAAAAEDSGSVGEDGSITVSVDGEEWTFYLESAKLYPSLDQMWVTYYAFNPRGETQYKLSLTLSSDLKPGEYQTKKADVFISLITDAPTKELGALQNYNSTFSTGGKTDGTLVLTERSSDWLTYKGSFDTDLEKHSGEKIHIECEAFEFTLGEEKELPYENDWAQDSGSVPGSFQNKPFF